MKDFPQFVRSVWKHIMKFRAMRNVLMLRSVIVKSYLPQHRPHHSFCPQFAHAAVDYTPPKLCSSLSVVEEATLETLDRSLAHPTMSLKEEASLNRTSLFIHWLKTRWFYYSQCNVYFFFFFLILASLIFWITFLQLQQGIAALTVLSQWGRWSAGVDKAETNLLIAPLDNEFMTSETYEGPWEAGGEWSQPMNDLFCFCFLEVSFKERIV